MGKELNRKKGMVGEEKAAAFMTGLGFEIIERNYSFKRGEVDIIAVRDGVIHFVEVKARKDAKHGHPLEAIDRKKIRHICAAAHHYLIGRNLEGKVPVSVDAVSIIGDEVQLIESITAML